MEVLINNVPERANSLEAGSNKGTLIVTQPKHLENILAAIAEVDRVSEKQGDASSGDWGGTGGGQGQQGDDGKSAAAIAREEAIARIPEPMVMQSALKQHIEQEVKTLRRQAQRLTKSSRPGAAFELSQMYAKIRRLNGMILELFDASIDVLKRLFIRVFIDKQSI